ncbi:MAG: TrkA family potassium uptake protein [Desulfitobacteriaceae bacterium]|nr:TrkA family potassium uptake protein [Desulfitobacteriaceae bacterium]MDI6880856.1 TrkA family potassium uptake protein [Desulfitobacteriaceae bacterium]MDI6913384.1 TrkA family potassium uptake protein [Desulfitobacteriaceae bacterium]
MPKQYAVIGLGRFGASVALTLSKIGHDVLAIDKDEALIHALAEDVTHAVQADAREEENLKALGLRNFDAVVVAIGDDIEANILITLMLKEMGVKQVVAKAQSELHGKVLARVGADRVIFPEQDMGKRLAYNLEKGNVLDLIELAPDYSVMQMTPPTWCIAKTLKDLNLRAKHKVSIVVIKKPEGMIAVPGAETVIESGDSLVLIGRNEDLTALQE